MLALVMFPVMVAGAGLAGVALTAMTGGAQGLRPLYVPSAAQHALNRLTKQRLRYQEEVCSIRRRLLDLIRWAQPALERALPDLQTTVALAVLEHYFDPQRLHRLGPRRLEGFLREHVGGNHPGHGPFIEALAHRLLEAAEATLALHGPDDVDFGRDDGDGDDQCQRGHRHQR